MFFSCNFLLTHHDCLHPTFSSFQPLLLQLVRPRLSFYTLPQGGYAPMLQASIHAYIVTEKNTTCAITLAPTLACSCAGNEVSRQLAHYAFNNETTFVLCNRINILFIIPLYLLLPALLSLPLFLPLYLPLFLLLFRFLPSSPSSALQFPCRHIMFFFLKACGADRSIIPSPPREPFMYPQYVHMHSCML